MTWLVDTNVVSELRKPNAHPNVVAWAANHDADDLLVSVITLHEIEVGILSKERSDARQGVVLRSWFTDVVLPQFDGRLTLPIDLRVGRIAATLHVPNRRPASDTWIAATALAHQLPLVTRNVKDFAGIPGLALLNPWDAA